MYPPIAAEPHWLTMSQIAALTVKAVADAPCPGHGEMIANPSPVPSATKMNETATATIAPAKIAGHDAADALELATAGPSEEPMTCSTAATGANTLRAVK